MASRVAPRRLRRSRRTRGSPERLGATDRRPGLDDLARGNQLVIEAALERLDLKREIFADAR